MVTDVTDQWLKSGVTFGLAFCFGYINMICTIRFQAFATMLTGNSIYFARSIVKGDASRARFYLVMIFSYASGAFGTRAVDHLGGKSNQAVAVLVVISAVVVDVAATVTPTDAWDAWYAWLIAFAMGAVNTVSTQVTGVTASSVTGNISKVSCALSDACFGKLERSARETAQTCAFQVCFFFLGVAVGAAVIGVEDFWDRHLDTDIKAEDMAAISFTLLAMPMAGLLLVFDLRNRWWQQLR